MTDQSPSRSNRPDDIPQDVWDSANYACCAAPEYTNYLHEVVARAILAERERCVKAAEHFTTARNVRRARELTPQEVYEVKIFARLLAHAIRKGAA